MDKKDATFRSQQCGAVPHFFSALSYCSKDDWLEQGCGSGDWDGKSHPRWICDEDSDNNAGRPSTTIFAFTAGLVETGSQTEYQSLTASQRGIRAELLILMYKYFFEGGLKWAFCLGKPENCDDPLKSVAGEINLKQGMFDGPGLTAECDFILAGGIMWILGESIGVGGIPLGPLGYIGFKDAVFQLDPNLEAAMVVVSFQGTLTIGEYECDVSKPQGIFYCMLSFVEEALSYFVIRIEATLQWLTQEYRLSVALKPIELSSKVLFMDSAGMGPALFVQWTNSAVDKQVGGGLKLGVSVEVSDGEWICFEGEIMAQVGVIPGLELTASLAMVGTWWNSLGLPFAHLSDVIAELSIRIVAPPPAIPVLTRIMGGGQICVGSRTACEGANTRFILMLLYFGVDIEDPNNNFIIGMVSTFTMEKFFEAFADTVSDTFFGFLLSVIPSPLLTSGLSGILSCTGEQMADPGANRDCFAWFSFAIMGQVIPKSTGTDIVVEPGLGFAGKLTICGFWIAAKFKVNMNPAAFAVYAYVEIAPIDILGFFKVYRSRSEPTKGPMFLLDVKLLPPSALIEIGGYIGIEELGTYCDVKISLSSEGFEFYAKTQVFWLYMSLLHIWWNWDILNLTAGFRMEAEAPDFLKYFLEGMELLLGAVTDAKTIFSAKMKKSKHSVDERFNNLKDTAKGIQPAILSTVSGLIIDGLKETVKFVLDAVHIAIESVLTVLEVIIQGIMLGFTIFNFFKLIKWILSATIVNGQFGRGSVGCGAKMRFFTFYVEGEFTINIDQILDFIWEQCEKVYGALTQLPDLLVTTFNDHIGKAVSKFMKDLGQAICNCLTVCEWGDAIGEFFVDVGNEIGGFFTDSHWHIPHHHHPHRPHHHWPHIHLPHRPHHHWPHVHLPHRPHHHWPHVHLPHSPHWHIPGW